MQKIPGGHENFRSYGNMAPGVCAGQSHPIITVKKIFKLQQQFYKLKLLGTGSSVSSHPALQ
jgi:hypothetical protein